MYPASSIQHPASSIQYPASSIQYPVFHHWWWILLPLVFSLAGCGANSKSKPAPDPNAVDIRPTVIFARADHQPLYYYIETQGIAQPVRKITVQLKISGFVKRSFLRDGRRVEKGDTLLDLNDEEWQLALKEAQTSYQKAKAKYFVQRTVREDVPAGGDTAYTHRMLRVQSGLQQAEIDKKKAIMNINYAHVVAPFSGILGTQQTFSPGQFVSAGTQLATLVDLSKMLVRLNVLEEKINEVKVDQPVQLILDDSTRLEGKITGISPLVNQKTKTGQVIALFNNPQRQLLPGMTVDARILTKSVEGRCRVPRVAVLKRDNRLLLFKLHGDEVEWIYVHPLAMNNEWVELNNKEIAPGDTIAVDRHFALSHKEKVTVKMEGTFPSAGEPAPINQGD